MRACLEDMLSWHEELQAVAGISFANASVCHLPYPRALQACWPLPAPVLRYHPCLRRCLQEGIYEQFSQSLVDMVNKFKLGNGMDSGVTLGPLISPAAVDRVRLCPPALLPAF